MQPHASQSHALIIEDNNQNIQVLGSLLIRQGIRHTDLTDLTRLDEVLAGLDRLDVIFLDLEMQGQSGYDVLNRLRANTRFQAVPVVAYTVHASEMITAYQLGFHSFLAKPLDSERFPDQLARILQGERVWGQI